MITFTLFTLSGAALLTLTLAKRAEEKRRKPFFILKAISLGDERIRNLNHHALRLYSVGKEKFAFFVKKRLPLHSRNSLNKFVAKLSTETERYIGNIRDSRLLKKPDGISEFFKNMSSVEKGAGEINEDYDDRERETELVKEIEPVVKMSSFKPKPPAKRTRKRPVKKLVRLVVKEE